MATALDTLAAVTQQLLATVHTCMPASVVRVHSGEHGRQFVDVQPSLRRLAFDERGRQVQEALPMLHMVPVGYMQGGGFFVAVPLAAGDFVTLVFAERSLDQWLEVARAGSGVVDQGDVGTHTLDGAIALPCGPAPRPELLEGVDGADLVVGGPAGILARFTASGDVVLAEGNTPLALATASDGETARIAQDLATLRLAIGVALKALQPATSLGAGEPISTAFLEATSTVPSAPQSVASTRIRGQ